MGVVRNKYSSLGVGGRIRQEREALGLTQTEVGAAAGVTKGAVSAWESGNTKNLRLENLFAIADKLKVNGRWLAIGSGPKHPGDHEAVTKFSHPSGKRLSS